MPRPKHARSGARQSTGYRCLTDRACLQCGRTFRSRNKANRVCGDCKAKAGRVRAV